MKPFLFLFILIAFLSSCKKEECKSCKYIGIHFIENAGSHSQDTIWRLGYDTIYQTKCSDKALPNSEFTSYYSYSDSVVDGKKVVITWVNKGTWYCE